MIRNIVGTPARGEDFFDREEIVDLLWDRVETNNVLLAAPRRYGKTSLMYRLLDDPRSGWQPFHVDAESIREPVNFIIALLDALMADKKIRSFLISRWKDLGKWMRGLLDETQLTGPWDIGVKLKFKEAVGPDWEERGTALLRSLRDYDGHKGILLIIDELPLMLELFLDNGVSDSDTKAFLYWFRRLRTDPGVGLSNCRFLIGGSIGIEYRLSELGAQASFNDFERVAVGPLGAKKGAELLERVLESRGIQLSKASRRKVLELIGLSIPYFIQIFVAEIATFHVSHGGRIGPKQVEEIYRNSILGPTCKGYFQHYYDRLRFYDKRFERAAKVLLKLLALAPTGSVPVAELRILARQELGREIPNEDISRLFADLANDCYIIFSQQSDSYEFGLKVLRDWWRRYYAF